MKSTAYILFVLHLPMLGAGCASTDISSHAEYVRSIGKQVTLKQQMMLWDQSDSSRNDTPPYQLTYPMAHNASRKLVATLPAGTKLTIDSVHERHYPLKRHSKVYMNILVSLPETDNPVLADYPLGNTSPPWER